MKNPKRERGGVVGQSDPWGGQAGPWGGQLPPPTGPNGVPDKVSHGKTSHREKPGHAFNPNGYYPRLLTLTGINWKLVQLKKNP